MKEKLFNFGKSLWVYANSNVGSVLVGATVSYVLTKGSREEELIDAKYKLDKTEEKLSKIEDKLQESESNISRLMQSGIDTRFELQSCLRNQDNLKNIYSSSFCLFRQPIFDTLKIESDKDKTKQSSMSGGK